MKKGQNIDIKRNLDSSNLMNDYEEFKMFSVVVKIARELELEMELDDVNELLQSYDQTWIDEELLLMEVKGGFSRWNLLLVKMLWWFLKWQQQQQSLKGLTPVLKEILMGK